MPEDQVVQLAGEASSAREGTSTVLAELGSLTATLEAADSATLTEVATVEKIPDIVSPKLPELLGMVANLAKTAKYGSDWASEHGASLIGWLLERANDAVHIWHELQDFIGGLIAEWRNW